MGSINILPDYIRTHFQLTWKIKFSNTDHEPLDILNTVYTLPTD